MNLAETIKLMQNIKGIGVKNAEKWGNSAIYVYSLTYLVYLKRGLYLVLCTCTSIYQRKKNVPIEMTQKWL
jgi:hypothetical protein